MYVGHRLLRTQFLPLFVQRRWLESRYHVRSAYEIFKVLPPKKKNAAPQQAKNFVGVNRRQNESGVLRGGKFFRGLFLTEVVGLTVITNHFLWLCSK